MAAGKHRGLRSRLRSKRVLICVGAGGVGKTTTSAALALGLAAHGQKVAVVTIDPARRLASALGLQELSGEPHRIPPETLAAQGVSVEGELWAMMLDAKRTFDEIVTRLAPDEPSREEILANPVYRELSTAVAGSHELSAIAKLYELHEEHDFDVIVLDTPPSRNALDFLSAPNRLLGFLDRPGAAGVPRPRRDHGAAVRTRHRPRLLDLRARHRRRHARRTVDVLPLAVERDRRLRRAHAQRRRAAARAGDGVPDRHLARAGAGARGRVLGARGCRRRICPWRS